jgi:hypothetical protein
MKKLFFVVIALVVFNNVNSQNDLKIKSKPKFGMKAGLNIANANASGDGAPSSKSLIGLNAGLFMEIKLNSKFSIQPEALYSQQGIQFDQNVFFEGNLYNTSNKIKLSYINIPLMVKYYADKNFYIEAGPQLGFLTKAEFEIKVDGQTGTENIKDSYKSTDIGINFGIGYDISNKIVVSSRYNRGLANALVTTTGDNSKFVNSVFSFSIGYKFE